MAWADFWEMLDGRIWYELQKQGVTEKREFTTEQADFERAQLSKLAKKAGWIE